MRRVSRRWPRGLRIIWHASAQPWRTDAAPRRRSRISPGRGNGRYTGEAKAVKRVLVVHFSQTGQLARVVRRLVAPLAAAPDVRVTEEVLRPRTPYPFPWP